MTRNSKPTRRASRHTNSQSVSLCWSTKSSGAPLACDATLKPYSLPTFLTMSEIVWFLNVRCLRERIMRCDLS